MKPDQPTWLIDPLDGTTNYVTGEQERKGKGSGRGRGRALAGYVYVEKLYAFNVHEQR